MMWGIFLPPLLLLKLGLTHSVTIETIYGPVEGQTLTLVDHWHQGIEVNSFYGIPFGSPPVGDLRFALPVPPEPWDDVFVADTHGTVCMQELDALNVTNPGAETGEECLNLNIFTPADVSEGPYPVFIWLHGGGFRAGANIQYQGHFLAAHGTVVVIPNYRLEIFGFGYSGDDQIPGNMGLWDQRLAMQFVQDNIGAFGGDPDRVTLGGQSAGAASTGQHILSPQSTGLFHQAILQSGSDANLWSTNGPNHNPEDYTFEAAEVLGCPVDDTIAMTSCLRGLDADVLLTSSFECKDGFNCMGFAPVVDGPGGFKPDMTHVVRQSGDFNHVPEMIGYNRHDDFPAPAALWPELEFSGPDRERFVEMLGEFAAFLGAGREEGREEDFHAAMDFYYTPWPHLDDREENRFQLGWLFTDADFGHSCDWQARSQSQYAPVHYYIFDYRSVNNPLEDWKGTAHGLELVFTMGNNFVRHNPEVQAETGLTDVYEFTDHDDEWGYFMVTLWSNYIQFGTPTPTPVQPPGENDPIDWPEYNTDTFAYMFLGESRDERGGILGDSVDYRQHENAFWREYVTYLFDIELL